MVESSICANHRLIAQNPSGSVLAIPETKLDDPGPEPMREYAPTVAVVLTMLGAHWLMHAGQFVAVRRKLGKVPLP